MDIKRVAIIDHETHTLFIEDIPLDTLNNIYGGSEENYIKDNYSLSGEWSWDYIVESEYQPCDDDPISFEISDLL